MGSSWSTRDGGCSGRARDTSAARIATAGVQTGGADGADRARREVRAAIPFRCISSSLRFAHPPKTPLRSSQRDRFKRSISWVAMGRDRRDDNSGPSRVSSVVEPPGAASVEPNDVRVVVVLRGPAATRETLREQRCYNHRVSTSRARAQGLVQAVRYDGALSVARAVRGARGHRRWYLDDALVGGTASVRAPVPIEVRHRPRLRGAPVLQVPHRGDWAHDGGRRGAALRRHSGHVAAGTRVRQ